MFYSHGKLPIHFSFPMKDHLCESLLFLYNARRIQMFISADKERNLEKKREMLRAKIRLGLISHDEKGVTSIRLHCSYPLVQ